MPSKNKESVVQNPIPAGSNQMTNNYGGIISPKDSYKQISEEIAVMAPFPEQEDGHFFFYFLSIVLIIMAGYLIFHNKQKVKYSCIIRKTAFMSYCYQYLMIISTIYFCPMFGCLELVNMRSC